ncbi:MAG: TetR/AcrR family transcriptional regulator [Acidimicrobiia bacterium]|nr:TetR/AcrR family transcriptional regulator [Acidimicrobiia bacterium]
MTTRSREDVVRAAGRLFALRGFHGTSMRDLGDELGLLGSSLYSHVDSKEQLLVEVIQRGADLFQALADEVSASGAEPKRKVADLVRGHVTIITSHQDMSATFLNEARFLPERERRAIVTMRDRYESTVRSLITEAIASGSFRQQDPSLATIMVLSVLNALTRWYRVDGRQSADEIADSIVEFVIEGLQ